jgi:hypothetical protein
MKKLLTIALLAGMTSFFGCGPSSEDKAAQEKASQDSAATADSMMKAAEQAAMPDTTMAKDTSQMMPDTTKKM